MESLEKEEVKKTNEELFAKAAFGSKLLKQLLERHLGTTVSDEMFEECLEQAPKCRPLSPIGIAGWMGYILPFRRIIKKYGWKVETGWGQEEEGAVAIKSFFFPTMELTRFVDPAMIFSSNRYKNIILHIPHSSTVVPSKKYSLGKDDRRLIDFYTDELFMREDERITPLVFQYSRMFCDVERLPQDPLDEIGYGISHDDPDGFVEYRDEKKAYQLYVEHHAALSQLLVEKSGYCNEIPLLIDCHSFSSYPNPLNPNAKETSNIDICIGYNEDGTKPDDFIIKTALWHFYNLGYNVQINTPFSNSKTVPCPVKYHSMMIEVNKRLYMNEKSCEKKDRFERVKNDIVSLYDKYLKAESKFF